MVCHLFEYNGVSDSQSVNVFSVSEKYVEQSEKQEETDRLFLDSEEGDGDYGEQTCGD